MRPYRGKRKDNGEWIDESFGILRRKDWDGKKWSIRYFLQEGYSCNETPKTENFVEVIPETVTQGSGKFDINNTEVFAGDKSKGHGVCVFTTDGIEGTAGFYWKDKEGLHHYEYLTTPIKIIGTIHDTETQNGKEESQNNN